MGRSVGNAGNGRVKAAAPLLVAQGARSRQGSCAMPCSRACRMPRPASRALCAMHELLASIRLQDAGRTVGSGCRSDRAPAERLSLFVVCLTPRVGARPEPWDTGRAPFSNVHPWCAQLGANTRLAPAAARTDVDGFVSKHFCGGLPRLQGTGPRVFYSPMHQPTVMRPRLLSTIWLSFSRPSQTSRPSPLHLIRR